jgi:hypothetical protein
VKKAVRYLVIAVIAVWLFEDPSGAAALAHHVMAGLTHAAHSLSDLASGL